MTVRFLTKMLTVEAIVVIKDEKTKKIIWSGNASMANFYDKVKNWDFSSGHVIYI